MRGRIFVPHFLTQTSFHCCQQQSPEVEAEEKKLHRILSPASIIHSHQREARNSRKVLKRAVMVIMSQMADSMCQYCFVISVVDPRASCLNSQRDKSGFSFLTW